jgi:hypothetical protein
MISLFFSRLLASPVQCFHHRFSFHQQLSTDKCDVKFLAPDGTVISHCESGRISAQITLRKRLQTLHNSFTWQCGECIQFILVYIRIIALLGMAVAAVAKCPASYMTLFWTAVACDHFLSRYMLFTDSMSSFSTQHQHGG